MWASRAEELARKLHKGQIDKQGVAYVEHLKRVAAAVRGDYPKATAWLHDAVEDGHVTLNELRGKFPSSVITALASLTRKKSEEYMVYIQRVSMNPMAMEVKIADLTDNLRPGGPPSLRKRYVQALEYLRSL